MNFDYHLYEQELKERIANELLEQEIELTEGRWNNERNNIKNPDYYAVVKAGMAATVVDLVDNFDVDFNELEPTTGRYTFTFKRKHTKKECMLRIDDIVKELRKYKPFDTDGILYMSGVSWYFEKYQRYWKCSFLIKGIE